MKREIIIIDESKCTGCGDCIPACHEGALQIIDGKARLISDIFCDGLGACLGHCPTGAINIETREAEPYDEKSVMHESKVSVRQDVVPAVSAPSALRQWPVQLHLVSPQAPYFKDSDLLLAADCTAFAVGDFHGSFMRGKSLAIACPKLDSDMKIYVEKLTAMIDQAHLHTITVAIMEVPCCGGLTALAAEANRKAKRKVPLKKLVISLQGEIKSEEWV